MNKFLITLVLTLAIAGCATIGNDSSVNHKNASNVLVKGIVTASVKYEKPPNILVVLFPGGNGKLGLLENSTNVNTYLKGNLVVSNRMSFLTGDSVVLTMDCITVSDNCPSDYRGGELRASDTLLIIKEIKKRYPSINKTWLIGMSRGAIDAGAVAYYAPHQISGVVYTSGVLWELINKHGIELSKIKSEQFIVQHADDNCSVSPASYAKEVSKDNAIPLILFNNGHGSKDGCDGGSPHSFYGQENLVISAINKIIQNSSIADKRVPWKKY